MDSQIIKPPEDLKIIIDKTAQFVAARGRKTEEMILTKESENDDFQFLSRTDHLFRPYYEDMVKKFSKGEETKVDVSAAKPKKSQKQIREELEKRATLQPPPPDQYAIVHPAISIRESERIKTSAQFIARNGSMLGKINHKNPEDLNFLKPTNKNFGYFTNILDSYSKVLMPKHELLQKLKSYSTGRESIMEVVNQRYYYEKNQIQVQKEQKKRKKEEKEEVEEAEEIDWDDFVLVDTIDLEEDDEVMPEYQPELTVEMLGVEDAGAKMDEANEVIQKELQEREKLREEVEIEPGMKIVTDHKKDASTSKETYQKCPKCGDMIAQSEWKEHMRIELLDKSWREDKEQYLRGRKVQPGNDEALSNNIKKIQAFRPDIFGETSEDKLAEQQKRMAEKQPTIVWDGQSNDISRTTANAVMMAQQQRNNLKETLNNSGAVDSNYVNRVQNNMPTKIKEMLENANSGAANQSAPAVTDTKEKVVLIKEDKWLTQNPGLLNLKI